MGPAQDCSGPFRSITPWGLALLVGALVFAPAYPAGIHATGRLVNAAEARLQAADLLVAEKLFRNALEQQTTLQQHCHSRLMTIYLALGRYSQAVEHGLVYQRWLRDNNQEQFL